MSTDTLLRRTPLYAIHHSMGARLVDFHGWELPIQFASILKEHQAVRTCCGIFDVSHMGQVLVEGSSAFDFLQRINSNDIGKIGPGKAIYSHVLNERGGVVDDVIVSCLARGRYMVVVNAATTDKDFAWFKKNAEGYDVHLENLSDKFAMLAVQGPQAERILSALVPACGTLPRFGVLEADLFGQFSIIQRTGYTGEDGFELIIPGEIAARVWEDLMTRGRSYGIAACGLGARDTLRLEAGYLLYGQDVDDDHSPFEARYDWVVKLNKGEFIGRDALARQKRDGLKRRFTGIKLSEKGVPRSAASVYLAGQRIGELTSATFSPTLQVGIGAGYLDRPDLAVGQAVDVEIHGRRIPATVAAMPFYRR